MFEWLIRTSRGLGGGEMGYYYKNFRDDKELAEDKNSNGFKQPSKYIDLLITRNAQNQVLLLNELISSIQ